MDTTTEKALLKTFPCNEELRVRLMTLRESGEITNAMVSRGSGVADAIISQYLNANGNTYPGDIGRYESQMLKWLDRRELETLAGIPSIPTPISEQVFSAARMVLRCGIMGKGIGKSGIGKTRAAALLATSKDFNCVAIFASKETGHRDFIFRELCLKLGIRGPRKGPKRRVMYMELIKRLRDTHMLIVVDQAHMLNKSAKDFLVELWNATHTAQLWLGTRKLAENLERDEQWASRLDFTFELSVMISTDVNEVRPLVEHQIKSRLPDVGPEFRAIVRLCEKLAINGSFRRVEMRLTTMLYLRESPRNKNLTWAELFEMAGKFLTARDEEE